MASIKEILDKAAKKAAEKKGADKVPEVKVADVESLRTQSDSGRTE